MTCPARALVSCISTKQQQAAATARVPRHNQPRRDRSAEPQACRSPLRCRAAAQGQGKDGFPESPQDVKQRAERATEDAKDHVQDMVESMEQALDEDTQAALDGIVGQYSFSEQEMRTFEELVDNMRGTAWGLLAATGITVVLSLTKEWLEGSFLPSSSLVMRGVTLARTFRVLDSLVLSALVYMGALAFKKVAAVGENQLAYCIQGIVQLGILFMQMAPIALALAVVDLMVAAIRWPGVLLIAACAAAAFSVARSGAVALLLSRYRLGTPGAAKALLLFRQGWSALPQFGPLDRSAILIVGASMLPFSPPLRPKATASEEEGEVDLKLEAPGEDSSGSGGEAQRVRPQQHAQSERGGEGGQARREGSGGSKGGDSGGRGGGEEYEFSAWEERVMEVVMESMRMAGMALAMRAMATICLGIAEVKAMSVGGAWAYFSTDLVDQCVRASLLFASAGCFGKVIRSSGRDITHLLEGLGSEAGVSLMFARMRKLTWGMTTWKSGELAALLIGRTRAWAALSGWVRQTALPATVHFLHSHVPVLQPLLASAGLSG